MVADVARLDLTAGQLHDAIHDEAERIGFCPVDPYLLIKSFCSASSVRARGDVWTTESPHAVEKAAVTEVVGSGATVAARAGGAAAVTGSGGGTTGAAEGATGGGGGAATVAVAATTTGSAAATTVGASTTAAGGGEV